MAQTKTEIQQLLQSAGLPEPRKRFGQNFMIDQNLIAKVAEAGRLQPGDRVIEVGPGTGTLTEELLASGADVIAVEIDRDLAELLRQRFALRGSFRLIEGDALAGKHELNAELLAVLKNSANANEPGCPQPEPERGRPRSPVKLVANLPYNIASPLVIEMLIAGVDLLAFTVQREVAERFAAKADGEHYGPLSIMSQMLGEVELLRILPPQAFWPTPRVESALVRIVRHDRLGPAAGEFSKFVHALFSARRKMLRKALSQAGYRSMDDLGIDLEKRVEVLSPGQLWSLWQAVSRLAPALGPGVSRTKDRA